MPGHLKKSKIIPKDTIFKFLASPMFCLQYMIFSYLIFSMKLRISFKLNFSFCLSRHRGLYRSYNNPPEWLQDSVRFVPVLAVYLNLIDACFPSISLLSSPWRNLSCVDDCYTLEAM